MACRIFRLALYWATRGPLPRTVNVSCVCEHTSLSLSHIDLLKVVTTSQSRELTHASDSYEKAEWSCPFYFSRLMRAHPTPVWDLNG
jgi:hypothetical protein